MKAIMAFIASYRDQCSVRHMNNITLSKFNLERNKINMTSSNYCFSLPCFSLKFKYCHQRLMQSKAHITAVKVNCVWEESHKWILCTPEHIQYMILCAVFSRAGTYFRQLSVVCNCSTTLGEEIKHVGVCRDVQEPVKDSDSDSGIYFNCWEGAKLQMCSSLVYFGFCMLYVQGSDAQSVYMFAIPKKCILL